MGEDIRSLQVACAKSLGLQVIESTVGVVYRDPFAKEYFSANQSNVDSFLERFIEREMAKKLEGHSQKHKSQQINNDKFGSKELDTATVQENTGTFVNNDNLIEAILQTTISPEHLQDELCELSQYLSPESQGKVQNTVSRKDIGVSSSGNVTVSQCMLTSPDQITQEGKRGKDLSMLMAEGTKKRPKVFDRQQEHLVEQLDMFSFGHKDYHSSVNLVFRNQTDIEVFLPLLKQIDTYLVKEIRDCNDKVLLQFSKPKAMKSSSEPDMIGTLCETCRTSFHIKLPRTYYGCLCDSMPELIERKWEQTFSISADTLQPLLTFANGKVPIAYSGELKLEHSEELVTFIEYVQDLQSFDDWYTDGVIQEAMDLISHFPLKILFVEGRYLFQDGPARIMQFLPVDCLVFYCAQFAKLLHENLEFLAEAFLLKFKETKDYMQKTVFYEVVGKRIHVMFVKQLGNTLVVPSIQARSCLSFDLQRRTEVLKQAVKGALVNGQSYLKLPRRSKVVQADTKEEVNALSLKIPKHDIQVWVLQHLLLAVLDNKTKYAINPSVLQAFQDKNVFKFTDISSDAWGMILPTSLYPSMHIVSKNEDKFLGILRTTILDVVKDGGLEEWVSKLMVTGSKRWTLSTVKKPKRELPDAEILADYLTKKAQVALHRNPLAYISATFKTLTK